MGADDPGATVDDATAASVTGAGETEMNDHELPPWLLGVGIGVFLLLLVGLWYRYLGPGSVPPPPTRVAAPDEGGMSAKARAWMQQGH